MEDNRVVTSQMLLEALDKIEAELSAVRQAHDCLPTPDHAQARRLLEKLGRRNRTTAHF